MVFKIILDDEHTTRLLGDMKAAGTDSVQDYFKWKVFGEEIPKASQELFSMDEAVRRALRCTDGQFFTLPDLFTDAEWGMLPSPKMAGVLGRRFFQIRIARNLEDEIRYTGRKKHRQTLYQRVYVKKEREENEYESKAEE